MTAAGRAAVRVPVAAFAWPLIAMRLLLLLAALVMAVPLYYLAAPFVRRNPVPARFLRIVAAICGLRVRVRGERPARTGFILANHVSWLDIPALAGTSSCAFVAHDGLAAIGPLRWLCDFNDTVFIARHERRSVVAQVEQVRTALRDKGTLAVFPEGTTSDGTGLLPFKSSLLSALESDADHIPVQPVWLDYGREARSIAWVGDEPGLANALRILGRWRPLTLTVHFLAVLGAAERADRKAMARAAHDAIAAAQRGA